MHGVKGKPDLDVVVNVGGLVYVRRVLYGFALGIEIRKLKMFFKNRILKLLNFYTRWSCSACAWS
jgi:hypothetical protein